MFGSKRLRVLSATILMALLVIGQESCPPTIPGGSGGCPECNSDVAAAMARQRINSTITDIYVVNCASARVTFNITVPGAGTGVGPWLDPGEYMHYQYPANSPYGSGTFVIEWIRMDADGYYNGVIGEQSASIDPGGALSFRTCSLYWTKTGGDPSLTEQSDSCACDGAANPSISIIN